MASTISDQSEAAWRALCKHKGKRQMPEMPQSILARVLRSAVPISLLVLALGVIILLADHIVLLESPEAERGVLVQMLREFGLIFCSIGLISVLYELLIRKQLIEDYNQVLTEILNPDASRLGVKALFLDRDDRANRGLALDSLLRSAKEEMFCMGLGFYQFLPDRRLELFARVQEGCRFRFLIFDVNSPAAQTLDSSLGYGNGTLLTFLKAQRQIFEDFIAYLAQHGIPAHRFQVRTYSAIPMFGVIHLDPLLPTGRMLVELHGCRVEGSSCPGLELSVQQPGWHGFYAAQLANFWAEAKPLTVPANIPTSLSNVAGANE